MTERFARWVVRRRVLIVIVSTLLLIPSVLGMAATRVNYDILSYLPEELESMRGEKLLEDEFHMASTALITVKGMSTADLLKMKAELSDVEGVDKVIWQDDLLDVTVPSEVLPEDIRSLYYRDDATLLLVTFKEKSASASTMNAIQTIEGILRKDCFLGGLSGILSDTKTLSDSEVPVYVALAGLLAAVVLLLGVKSFVLPFLFLLGIVYPILYNMGTNVFLGQVSYITKALAAVLQLGVTMDFSIFLMNRYDEECAAGKDREDAMTGAITKTFSSIAGSSLTTIAGFLAMCTMSLALGADIGIVMAKGVLLGVISTVTILPAMLMFFDKPIHRFTHPVLIPRLNKTADGIMKARWLMLVLAVAVAVPAFMAQQKTDVYYTLTDALPADLPAVEGTSELKSTFDMATTHFIFVDDALSDAQVRGMIDEIEDVDGVESVIALEKVLGAGIPDEFVPDDIKDIVRQGGKKMFVVNTGYRPATADMDTQLTRIGEIVKSRDANALVTGEGAMTRDLVHISDTDFKNVNAASMALVFIIIALVFKSLSVPAVLVSVIELAIAVNMGVPYFEGAAIPFIASIVIGTIQLGATVDYAILMTTRFREEMQAGLAPKAAATAALKACSQSIITSALTFFGVTFGVAVVSKIELISGLCLMMARGALVSMAVILLVLPPLLSVTSGLIRVTTWRWLNKTPAKAA